MAPRLETMANIEIYIVSDKMGIKKNIKLKKEYIIIIWKYTIVVYESKIFTGTMLYHLFIGDITWFQLFYNNLFLITSTLVIKFVSFIILSPNKKY